MATRHQPEPEPVAKPPEPEATKPQVNAPQGADRGSDSGEEETPPDPGMETVVHEQRKRSAEIEAMGVEAWKAAHDERNPKDQPKQVPGVAKPHEDNEHPRRSR